MIIRFFDWEPNGGFGASTTNGDESTVDCFCSENPQDWWNWDVSIHLSVKESHELRVRLANAWSAI